MSAFMSLDSRPFLREPIPQIAEAARYLDEAVSAHLDGRSKVAEELIRRTNTNEIRAWTESLWGKNSPHVKYRRVPDAPPKLTKPLRAKGDEGR